MTSLNFSILFTPRPPRIRVRFPKRNSSWRCIAFHGFYISVFTLGRVETGGGESDSNASQEIGSFGCVKTTLKLYLVLTIFLCCDARPGFCRPVAPAKVHCNTV